MFGLFRRQNADVVVAHQQIVAVLESPPQSLAAFEQFADAIQGRVLHCPADYQAAVSGLFFALRQCLKVEHSRADSTGWGNAGRRFFSYLFGGFDGVSDCLETEREAHAVCNHAQQEVFVPQLERAVQEYHKLVKKYL